jgi:hypothetical protein
MIIGIAGRKGAGKSTVAERLEDHGFGRMSFATTIKRMVSVLLRGVGLSEAEIRRAEIDKEAVIPALGVSYRRLCQTLGTDWGRDMINPGLWLMCANRELVTSPLDHVVFDDVRFEGEANLIRQRGGLIIHVIRQSDVIDDHASESGIELRDGDAVVGNNGSLEGLFSRVFMAIESRLGAQPAALSA